MRFAHSIKSGRRMGFTMMELLVVLGIFSTTVTMASDIFMMASRAQRKVFALERTQADARFTMEAIIREVRSGSIDYRWYQEEGDLDLTAVSSVSSLAIVDREGRRIRFWKADEPQDCPDSASVPCLRVSIQLEGGEPSEAPMTPNGVRVVQCRFYISPKVDPTVFDPATGTFPADAQPLVTVVLTMQSASSEPIQQTVVYFQSSAATRNYGR